MTDSKRRLAPAPPGTPGGNDAHPRRKNVGTACSACKARKLKCTGTAPCANCVKSRLECTLDQTLDKRRRGALKRKIDQLEEKEDLLFRLVNVLRESGNRSTIPLLNLIRSNASLPEIQHYLNHQVPEVELALMPELIEVSHEVQRLQDADSRSVRRILDAKRLSDQPLFQVPAKPWTSVVSDNDFVSHLVSLWLTWSHPFSNWVDRGQFVHDMQAGLLGAKYCSPFLVNAILAYACTYSDYPEAYAVPGDVSSKGAHFYNEAKRLLDKEEGRISLPTVQGIGVLWARQLAYSANELAQKHAVLSSTVNEDELRMARVVNNTSWGLFNSATLSRETLMPYTNHDTIDPAQALTICLSSARSLAHWMQMYRTTWGLEHIPIFHIQWIQAALFILLENLQKEVNCEAFIILSIAAKAFSRRFEKAKRLLWSLQDTAQEMRINLPVEAAPLFVEIDSQWLMRPVRIKEETSDTASGDV
ncbi:hypothetical protein APSETT444_007892 [Aspergillus pseudonomiae]